MAAVRYVIRRWSDGSGDTAPENRIVHICETLNKSEAWMQAHGFHYNGNEYVHANSGQRAMFFPVPEARVQLLERAIGKYITLVAEVPLLDAEGILGYDPESYRYTLGGRQYDAHGAVVAGFHLRFTVLDVVTITEELGTFTIGLLQPARRTWFCAPGSPTA